MAIGRQAASREGRVPSGTTYLLGRIEMSIIVPIGIFVFPLLHAICQSPAGIVRFARDQCADRRVERGNGLDNPVIVRHLRYMKGHAARQARPS